jgi:hypothetical protein
MEIKTTKYARGDMHVGKMDETSQAQWVPARGKVVTTGVPCQARAAVKVAGQCDKRSLMW